MIKLILFFLFLFNTQKYPQLEFNDFKIQVISKRYLTWFDKFDLTKFDKIRSWY